MSFFRLHGPLEKIAKKTKLFLQWFKFKKCSSNLFSCLYWYVFCRSEHQKLLQTTAYIQFQFKDCRNQSSLEIGLYHFKILMPGTKNWKGFYIFFWEFLKNYGCSVSHILGKKKRFFFSFVIELNYSLRLPVGETVYDSNALCIFGHSGNHSLHLADLHEVQSLQSQMVNFQLHLFNMVQNVHNLVERQILQLQI